MPWPVPPSLLVLDAYGVWLLQLLGASHHRPADWLPSPLGDTYGEGLRKQALKASENEP